MRRAVCLFLALALWLSLGCPQNQPTMPTETASSTADTELLSTVNVADPRASEQLVDGFYWLEQSSWRWTSKRFAVSLPTPPKIPGHPAVLGLRFTIPDVVTDTLGPITLTARVNGHEVTAQRWEQPGMRLLMSVEVPDDVLTEDPTRVEFELDKALDERTSFKYELGIVVLSVSLK